MDLEQRVRRLAAAGGDLHSVRLDLDAALRASIDYDVASIATVDPATMLWTSCQVSGLPGEGEAEREKIIYALEFAGEDFNLYSDLATSGRLVGRLHQATGGDLTKSKRWEPLLSTFDVSDEMRIVLSSRDLVWGVVTLYRRSPKPPFSERDESTARGAVTVMADLFRLTMLRAAIVAPAGIDRPPGMIVAGPDGDIRAITEAAQVWLDAIDNRERIPSAVRAVAAAAAAGDGLAHAVFPVPEGGWVMLHASPLPGEVDSVGIIVEGARPIALSEVIARAYGLTVREREITTYAAQGLSTKQIAGALGISPFTVQDHLKAVFAKAGVQSRAELVAAMYIQHYQPKRAVQATPGPYGWYLDNYASAS